jgi:LuxR family transcriptional regulator, quorum-sensing system regulator SolR
VWTFETFVEQSQRQTTVDDLRTVFERALAEDGFENYVVGSIVDGAITNVGWACLPDGHLETYFAERWDKVDPVLAVTMRAKRPFCWDDVAPTLRFTAPQIALLDECKRVGVHSIVVAPFHNPDGCCDVVGLSRRHPDPPDPARIPVLMAACAQTLWRYCDLTGSSLTSEPEIDNLTSRELEILKWVKHGKNNTEISELISVSTKTIEYHIGNILKKLDASNRTAAVVIALRNKLLPL